MKSVFTGKPWKACSLGEQRRRLGQTGAVAVEFALVVSLLLLIVGGIVEVGRIFWYYDALLKASRDGARYLSMQDASVIQTSGVPGAVSIVVNSAANSNVPDFSAANVSVTCDGASCVDNTPPQYVRVAITGFNTRIGGLIPIFVPFSSATGFDTSLSPATTMRYMK